MVSASVCDGLDASNFWWYNGFHMTKLASKRLSHPIECPSFLSAQAFHCCTPLPAFRLDRQQRIGLEGFEDSWLVERRKRTEEQLQSDTIKAVTELKAKVHDLQEEISLLRRPSSASAASHQNLQKLHTSVNGKREGAVGSGGPAQLLFAGLRAPVMDEQLIADRSKLVDAMQTRLDNIRHSHGQLPSNVQGAAPATFGDSIHSSTSRQRPTSAKWRREVSRDIHVHGVSSARPQSARAPSRSIMMPRPAPKQVAPETVPATKINYTKQGDTLKTSAWRVQRPLSSSAAALPSARVTTAAATDGNTVANNTLLPLDGCHAATHSPHDAIRNVPIPPTPLPQLPHPPMPPPPLPQHQNYTLQAASTKGNAKAPASPSVQSRAATVHVQHQPHGNAILIPHVGINRIAGVRPLPPALTKHVLTFADKALAVQDQEPDGCDSFRVHVGPRMRPPTPRPVYGSTAKLESQINIMEAQDLVEAQGKRGAVLQKHRIRPATPRPTSKAVEAFVGEGNGRSAVRAAGKGTGVTSAKAQSARWEGGTGFTQSAIRPALSKGEQINFAVRTWSRNNKLRDQDEPLIEALIKALSTRFHLSTAAAPPRHPGVDSPRQTGVKNTPYRATATTTQMAPSAHAQRGFGGQGQDRRRATDELRDVAVRGKERDGDAGNSWERERSESRILTPCPPSAPHGARESRSSIRERLAATETATRQPADPQSIDLRAHSPHVEGLVPSHPDNKGSSSLLTEKVLGRFSRPVSAREVRARDDMIQNLRATVKAQDKQIAFLLQSSSTDARLSQAPTPPLTPR